MHSRKNKEIRNLRSVLLLSAASLGFIAVTAFGIFNNEHVQVSLFNRALDPVVGVVMTPLAVDALGERVGEWTYCNYTFPESPEYSVEFVSASVSPDIQAGERFEMDFEFKNTGNVRLFSSLGACDEMPHFQLGTQKAMDRDSIFGGEDLAVSGWDGANRIAMSERYADPGETFHVRAESLAPSEFEDDLYREFFQPVVEGVAWFSDVISVDIEVGVPTDAMRDDMSFVSEISTHAQELAGKERNLVAVLSEQRMYAKFGDMIVWSMSISSGAHDTPTPRGHYNIFQKQELRVGGKSPHYRMPYWQFLDARGYGIHGMPYLGSQQSSNFWKEANNHIGRPVSHGCIRTLDEDAIVLYRFTRIGTPVVVR